MNIAIYIYDDAEVLDFAGPFEVLSTANRFLPANSQHHVFCIAEHQRPTRARGGFNVIPDYGFDEHPPIDTLIVVGGIHNAEIKKKPVIEWIKLIDNQAQYVVSICTGAFLLAEAGLLDNLSATTHWEDIEALRSSYPCLNVIENTRWVDEGRYMTSGGISAGIDMSLHLVSKIHSLKIAEKTAHQMEFDWRRN